MVFKSEGYCIGKIIKDLHKMFKQIRIILKINSCCNAIISLQQLTKYTELIFAINHFHYKFLACNRKISYVYL